jgi:hypothetical protein
MLLDAETEATAYGLCHLIALGQMPMRRIEQQALNTDAERRLRKVLGRKPTAKEIAELHPAKRPWG